MPGVWGPQVSDYINRCPYCGSERCRILWSWVNAFRAVVQVFIGVLYFHLRAFSRKTDDEYSFAWKLQRRCRDCGARFDPTAGPPDGPECGRCRSDLSGTATDNCPECGWLIPGPVRALRSKEQRAAEGRFS